MQVHSDNPIQGSTAEKHTESLFSMYLFQMLLMSCAQEFR